MNTDIGSTSAPKGFEVNLAALIKNIIKRFWLIVIAAVVGGLAGFIYASPKTVTTYSTNLSFTTYNKAAVEVISSGDISTSMMMSNTFIYILKGRTMCERVAQSCSFEITAEEVAKCMNVSAITGTNIIKIVVTNSSAEKAYEIAIRIAEHYQEIVEFSYPNAILQMYEKPFKPITPSVTTQTKEFAKKGALYGALAALAVIVLTVIVKNTVQSADDIRVKLSSNLLGSVGAIRKKNRLKNANLIITDRGLGFSFVEAYKSIRTKVESFCSRHDYKVIMVTSTEENEGKTTVSVNLALSLAQNGKNVLLVDTDMRNPSVGHFLNISSGRDSDFSTVISGKSELKDAIKYIEKYKLFVLPMYETKNNPTEMLSSNQTEKIINAAKGEFDYVILDTAPAGVVTDAAIIAGYSDASILVVRDNYAPISRIYSVIDDLNTGNAEFIGCIYNNVSLDKLKRSYSKYRNYSSRYGSAYRDYGSNNYDMED